MSGDGLAFLVGLAAGLAFVGGFLWVRRAEVSRVGAERRTELFGTPDQRIDASSPTHLGLRRTPLAIAVDSAAMLACGAFALFNDDPVLRLVNLALFLILAISLPPHQDYGPQAVMTGFRHQGRLQFAAILVVVAATASGCGSGGSPTTSAAAGRDSPCAQHGLVIRAHGISCEVALAMAVLLNDRQRHQTVSLSDEGRRVAWMCTTRSITAPLSCRHGRRFFTVRRAPGAAAARELPSGG